MANSQHVKINLIGKPRENLGKDFLAWAVSAGRIIIVLTELIALGALLYRFNIDRKIVDLHDQIKREDLFVSAQAAKERDYRSIQTRLSSIKEINEQTQTKIKIMNDILKSISRGSFSSTNLTVNQSSINISGVAFSIFPLNDFINYLKENPNVTSISIDEIRSTAGGIQFKMTIELKKNAKV
ncbi:MAG: hypothetical protein A2776_01520 [Candidatus Levybacteria bacterium RIFCSPHIGHO2_01_FULL_40_10]|nr:MAG: hypothetical protein A2776_01520 [Candidatus Levybacteria bacterium RIFCSPHIGHO2_01_FULL_40_10]